MKFLWTKPTVLWTLVEEMIFYGIIIFSATVIIIGYFICRWLFAKERCQICGKWSPKRKMFHVGNIWECKGECKK